MVKENLNIELIAPRNQLSLFGYQDYFASFVSLVEKKSKELKKNDSIRKG